ncbi:Stk1 family PASTA domain-containing Ser/Thr kinase [Schaalia vaccimaxillae]|uniref:Stk1 family PASTA domain-containing Ser/Thr kinase n=1 Tax=Schaalia vaccimaxillae TaxID=183916 RepID=UPI0003B58831|nr:Stk1 family PASTA domain-containing Ser/Thr kinase [Schaalia vaccimaxillae]
MAESMARRLAGRYEIRSLIGRGGMAEVHLGFDARLSRIVAIKMLRTDLAQDSIFQARFRREAQSAASLNHPNIVAVYDTGEEMTTGSDGRAVSVPYIVMEYVEGHTVKELISDGTPVPIDEAVEIVSGVLSAIQYSHAANLVHRDIKPGNIMLTNDGKVKVMDFGIARAMTDSQATMTQTNAVVGTAQYLSPEQARGEQVDARSDIYSTGVVLFELLTGRPPFTGDSAVAVAYQHVQQLPPVPSSVTPDIPEALDRVVMKALAKERENRYASASTMLADLMRAARGGNVNAPETTVWASASGQTTATMPLARTTTVASPSTTNTAVDEYEDEEEPRKNRIGIIIGLVIAALAIIGLVWWGLSNTEPEKETVAVPAGLVGMTQAEAKSAIEGAGLVWAVADDPVPSEDVAEGSVAKTDPASGATVEVGSTVTAYLSSGPESVVLPTNLVGMSPEEAKKAVEALGLVWEVASEEVASEDVEKGKIAQINPSGGSKVKTGSTVTGYVSSGSNTVQVPDLSGMTQDQAREALAAKGLSVGTIDLEDSASVKEGLVISTNPAVGSDASKGDEISLVVSTGLVAVPDYAGLSQDQYVTALSEAGLRPVMNSVTDTATKGAIVSVDPGVGTRVAQGSNVKVNISTGPTSQETPKPDSGTDSGNQN